MDKPFVWIVPADALSKGGISLTYIVPSATMNELAKGLERGGCWLVGRDKREDLLLGFIKPKRIERFTDGYHEGDYLLYVDPIASFRIDSISKYFQFHTYALWELTPELHRTISEAVLASVTINYTPPSAALVESIPFEPASANKNAMARGAIAAVIKRLSLDQIWKDARNPDMGPFGHFALALLERRVGKALAEDCRMILQAFDPLRSIQTESDDVALSRDIRPRLVDTDFIEIDPDTIYARQLVASGNGVDLEVALDKTETAEKLHQDMLRDIVIFLRSKGVRCFQTGSIDLMFRKDDRMIIMEIKSATDDNVIAQAAKGAFQLAYYAGAVAGEYGEPDRVLILQKVGDASLQNDCGEALNRLGCKCLVYDPSREWPGRVDGIGTIS